MTAAIATIVYIGASAAGTVVVAGLTNILFGAVQRAGPDARAERRAAFVVAGILALWLGTVTVLGISGRFVPSPSGRFPLIALPIIPPLIVGLVALRRVRPLRRLLDDPSTQVSVTALQAFRIGGSSLLVLLALGLLPALLAVPLGIGDSLTGLLALPAAAALRAGRRGQVVAWNLLGIVDLVSALVLFTIAGPGRLHLITVHPSVAVIASTAQVIVPTFLVPVFLLLHAVSLRAALRGRAARSLTSVVQQAQP